MALVLSPGRGAARRGGRPPGGRGFTMVEVLIAMLLLLVVVVGLVPLFTKAIAGNRQGQDSTDAVSVARSQLEELTELPFNDARLLITSGTERQIDDHYPLGSRRWTAGMPPDGTPVLWRRQTRVRQFNVVVDPDLTNPLPSTATPSEITLREITVTVTSGRSGGPLGANRPLVVRVLKAR